MADLNMSRFKHFLERLDHYTKCRPLSCIIGLPLCLIYMVVVNALMTSVSSMIAYGFIVVFNSELGISFGNYMFGSFIGTLFRIPMLLGFILFDCFQCILLLGLEMIANDLLGNYLIMGGNVNLIVENILGFILISNISLVIWALVCTAVAKNWGTIKEYVSVCSNDNLNNENDEENPLDVNGINEPDEPMVVEPPVIVVNPPINYLSINNECKEMREYKEIDEFMITSNFTLKEFERSFPIDVHSYLYCSISHELMTDPVMLGETGHTYDRKEITEYLNVRYRDHHDYKDPVSNLKISNTNLTPNYDSREMILNRLEEFKQLNVSV